MRPDKKYIMSHFAECAQIDLLFTTISLSREETSGMISLTCSLASYFYMRCLCSCHWRFALLVLCRNIPCLRYASSCIFAGSCAHAKQKESFWIMKNRGRSWGWWPRDTGRSYSACCVKGQAVWHTMKPRDWACPLMLSTEAKLIHRSTSLESPFCTSWKERGVFRRSGLKCSLTLSLLGQGCPWL